MTHDREQDLLPWTGMTLEEVRSRLSGYHFSKESLSQGERDILYIAEGLLRLLDDQHSTAQVSRLTRQVLAAHRHLDAYVNEGPASVDIPEDLRDTRIDLLTEEVDEQVEAARAGDLVKIADGLGDIAFVVFGTALTYGVPLDAVLDEIYRSNVTKTSISGGGKFIKGPNFSPADVRGVLQRVPNPARTANHDD